MAVGIPWQEICRHVEAEEYGVVIAEMCNLGHVGRVLFGSTGMQLLRHCPAPVWISRPEAHDNRFEILVPSDLSEASLGAISFALEIGRFSHACVHLVHVVEKVPSLPAWYGYAPPQVFVEEYIAKRLAGVKKRLHDQVMEVRERSSDVNVHVHVVEGSPDEAILQAVDDLKINLVVMGTAVRTRCCPSGAGKHRRTTYLTSAVLARRGQSR